jgi:hypothetical protein
MESVTYGGDPWSDQRKLLDQLANARSGKHGASIVAGAMWRWVAVNLPRRLWPRVIVISVLVFGVLGLLLGAVLKTLGAPGSPSAYGASIGAVVGIAVALVAFTHGAWLRHRARRSFR